MLPVILGFLGIVALFTLMMYVVGRLTSVYVRRIIEGRLTAIDQIVNEQQIPEVWIRRYRKRLCASQEAEGKVPRENLMRRAQKRCLTKLDDLIRYAENVNFTDTPETKRLMVTALREQRARWDSQAWASLIAQMCEALPTDNVATGQPTVDETSADDVPTSDAPMGDTA